jgi:hypothetical protein
VIEQLTPDRALELWPQLEPIFLRACQSNEISRDDVTPADILIAIQAQEAIAFTYWDEKGLGLVMVFQFHTVNGIKGVDILSLGGRDLFKFARLYWTAMKDWLRSNDVKFIDAYANPRMASIYLRRLGFTKSCVYVRTIL